MECDTCHGKGTVIAKDENGKSLDPQGQDFTRECPRCEGYGSIDEMLAHPPGLDPKAKINEVIETKSAKILKMNDDTFRTEVSAIGSRYTKHFAVGRIQQRTDDEIFDAVLTLLIDGRAQYFHEDGTPHK